MNEATNNQSAVAEEIASILEHLRRKHIGSPVGDYDSDKRESIMDRNSAESVADALGKLVNQLPKGSIICLK